MYNTNIDLNYKIHKSYVIAEMLSILNLVFAVLKIYFL